MSFKPTLLPAFPDGAVTQTAAFLGKRGSGKTYAAGRMVESFLEGGAQVVVLDPVGNWWGLRLARDGKKPSKFQIPILGGERGDVPLEATAGAVVAKFVVETGSSCVLDVSAFTKADMKRFVRAFADELFRLKKKSRSPIHVVLEEAQLFAPQRVAGDAAALLGAIEYLVRLGRNYGIGVSMLSQRPQSVNKELLNQAELLVVFQLVGAHERKAVQDWTREMGADKAEIDELPGLGVGDCFVWSPSWLRIFERTRFLQKATYDASGTPTMAEQDVGGELKPVQLDALQEAMRTTIERAKATDPRHLRRRIAELERELAQRGEKVDVEHVAEAVAAAVDARDAEFSSWHSEMLEKLRMADRNAEGASSLIVEVSSELISGPGFPKAKTAPAPAPARRPTTPPRPPSPRAPASNGAPDAEGLGRGGMRRMFDALVTVAPAGLTESQWATIAKLAKTGGTWAKYRGLLVKDGHVENVDGLWYARGVDRNTAGLTTIERRDLWKRALGRRVGSMIDIVVENNGQISRGTLADALGLESSGGTFGKYLGFLTRNGLAKVEDGIVVATEEIE